MPQLNQSEFDATYSDPMRRVPLDAEPPFDFWVYFDEIPEDEFQGHDCSECAVDYAYTSGCGNFQHVLLNSQTQNVFMVLVLNLGQQEVVGHRLLNLNDEYGISG